MSSDAGPLRLRSAGRAGRDDGSPFFQELCQRKEHTAPVALGATHCGHHRSQCRWHAPSGSHTLQAGAGGAAAVWSRRKERLAHHHRPQSGR
jgi:hypothetical protein